MGRTGYPAVPATARGRATRRRLLEAAEEVFGAKGFERASIVDVTRGAGVAQGTFYVYFPDKRAIVTELGDELGHDLRRHIAEAVEGITDRMAVERAGFQAFFQFIGAHGIAHQHGIEGSRPAGSDGQHQAAGDPGPPGR